MQLLDKSRLANGGTSRTNRSRQSVSIPLLSRLNASPYAGVARNFTEADKLSESDVQHAAARGSRRSLARAQALMTFPVATAAMAPPQN